MRAPILILMKSLAICCGVYTASAAEEPFPYVVHVTDEGVPLRSGPGDEYYETSRLSAGAAVEVWRHAPGGWLAVRPPRGSFSLVAAADVPIALRKWFGPMSPPG